jgi:hypothetical protein
MGDVRAESACRLLLNMKEKNRNPWSGHSALFGKLERKWQNTGYVLSYFGDEDNSRKNYSRYIRNGINPLVA